MSSTVVTLAADINDQTGQVIADTLLAWIRPFIIGGALAIALYFLVQKQFSKVWTVVIIGAVVFALTIGTGETSIIGRLATWIASWFGSSGGGGGGGGSTPTTTQQG